MRKPLGFTLIEVLVVVAMLGIMLALAVPALGDFLQNGRVKAVSSALRDGLLAARTEAIRCNKSRTLTSTGTGWSFPDCEGNTRTREASSSESRVTVTYAAGTGTAATLSATVTQAVTFSGAGRATAGTGTFNISATGADLTQRVLVNAGGLVRTCNPNAISGAADAC